MADDPNIFDQIGTPDEKMPLPQPAEPNPFDEIGPKAELTGDTSTFGSFRRSAERNVAPALGGLVAMGAGAELGAAGGALIGGPLAPITAPIGGVVGGVAGMLLGSTAISSAQSWALSKLPDSWREKIGMDDRQQRLDEQEHSTASFLGGLTPFALTMRPGGFARGTLPENATAMQRIMAHPATARVFGGTVMGGLELGNEITSGEAPDWTKVGIATGFGVIWNKPTKLGESITEFGAGPTRSLVGRETARAPTVAEAGDVKVMGPGITEDVFMGTHEQAPEAASTAQSTAQTEKMLTTPPVPPELHATARKLEPELFEHYDALAQRREEFRTWIDEHANPPDEHVADASAKVAEVQRQLDEHMEARKGYGGGPEARRLRAQLRDAEAERDVLLTRRSNYIEGKSEESPEAAAARKHLLDVDYQMRDLAPQVSAAYRRAAEWTGGEIVPAPPAEAPETTAAAPAPVAAPAGEPAPGAIGTAEVVAAPLKTVAEQKASIAADVARKLVAVGRPQAEAVAAGHVYANQIATRAARFGGKRGTPEELYAAEGAEIRGEGQPVVRENRTTPPPTEAAPAPTKAVEAPSKAPEAPSTPVPAVAALPKGYEDWTPGATVKVGPIAGMTVVSEDGGKFILQKGSKTYSFEPPAKIGKEKTGLEMLEHLVELKGAELPPRVTETVAPSAPAAPAEPPKPAGPAHSFDDAVAAEKKALQEAPKKKRQKIKELNERARFEAFQKEAGLELRDIMAEQPDVDREFFESIYKIYRRDPGETPAAALWRAIDEKAGEIEKNAPIANDAQMAHDLRVLNEHFESEFRRGAGATFLDSDQFGKFERHLPAGPRSTFGGLELEREFTQTPASGGGTGEGGRAAPGEGGRTAQAGELPADGGAPRGEGNAVDPFGTQEFEQGHLGKIKIQGGRRSVITLMKDANASTAIHEFGHDFFEQLDRDSRHAAAPDELKADAATIRKWAGASESGPISVRAHEKVARGFERYMREGVAPSKELAGVFAQFKNWLMEVYRSVKELRAPINDDIRQVFDRMLAEEPNHTVIAPEAEHGPMIADIHEADAVHTEPAQAEPVADRVAAERAQIIEEPPPQVRNEIEAAITQDDAEQAAAKPAGENAGGAGGPGEVVPGGGEPGAKPGGGGVGEGRGEVGSGGGKAAGEGKGVSGPEQRRGTGPDAGPPLAPAPARLLSDESPFVDKAGNIRLENLTNDADVRQAIHDAADRNNDFIGDRRGVITDGQVMDLADALGMDYHQLNARKIGQAFNAEQIIAARKLLIESATEVSAAMKKASIGTDEDVMAYAQSKARHQMIQGQVSGITAEAGRALRAFRSLAGQEGAENVDQFLRNATGQTLFQLRREAKLGATLDTPEQVSRHMKSMGKRTAGRMVLEEWINALISGPATHTTYMIGNTLLALQKAAPETAAAALIGKVRAAMGREGETIRMGEVAAGLAGGARGVVPALKATIDALRTGVTTMLPGESLRSRTVMPFQPGTELVQPAILDEAAKFSDAMGSAFGLMRGLRDGIIAQGALLKAGGIEGAPLIGGNYSQLGAIPDIAIRGTTVLPIGSVIRLPSRAIAAIHSFFRSVNYSMDKAAGSYRIAANEGRTGTDFDARVGELRQDPTEAQMEGYRHEATELTLMGQGSKFTQALGRLTNTEVFGFPILKFIDPFVHISSNVIDQSIIQRTPVGLLSPELRADLLGKNGNIAQDKAQARMLVGSMVALTFGGLAAEGYASGSGPSDPKEAAVWRQAGNQAHSVRIGDIWYDTHRLGPLGMLMGVGADMYEVAHTAAKGEMLKAASHLQHAITQNVLDESFMRGPSDLIRAIEDPGRYGEAYIRNFLSSFVPYSVGLAQVNRAIDPYSRQARTVVDAMKAKVPGLSQDLMPRRDIWGEPMPNRDALISAGVTAIYETHINNDPVNRAMLELGVFPAPPERKIRNVQLTDSQFDQYSMTAGRMAKMRLDMIVKSPDWGSWPAHVRHDVIQETIRQSRESARGLMMAKYPDIPRQAAQQKLEKVRGNNE